MNSSSFLQLWIRANMVCSDAEGRRPKREDSAHFWENWELICLQSHSSFLYLPKMFPWKGGDCSDSGIRGSSGVFAGNSANGRGYWRPPANTEIALESKTLGPHATYWFLVRLAIPAPRRKHPAGPEGQGFPIETTSLFLSPTIVVDGWEWVSDGGILLSVSVLFPLLKLSAGWRFSNIFFPSGFAKRLSMSDNRDRKMREVLLSHSWGNSNHHIPIEVWDSEPPLRERTGNYKFTVFNR